MEVLFFGHVINMLANANVLQQMGWGCQNELNAASVCYAFTKHIISASFVSEG